MFVALALYFTIRGRDGGRTLIAAGLVAGLAASTKYNAGAVVIAPLVVALALPSPAMARVRLGVAVTLASVVGFAMLTPVVLIDPGVILNALHGQVVTYSSRPGQTGGNSFGYWLDYLWSPALGPAFAIASVAGMVAAAMRRERTMIAILAFTVVYFVIVSFPSVRFERNLIPLFPALAILTGVALSDLMKRRRLAINAIAVAVFAIGATTALAADVDNDLTLMRPDPRTVALDWINANLPPGSRIAREDYSPQPSPARFEVGVIPFLSDHPLQWYRDQEVDFLVASSYAYGWVIGPGEQFYRDLSALPLLVDIPPGTATAVGPEIKIYDLRSSR
jgi:4-amino-4-deoxy-L-arabinose transferase-like glycosyltransferase